jgi:hypothetical protein
MLILQHYLFEVPNKLPERSLSTICDKPVPTLPNSFLKKTCSNATLAEGTRRGRKTQEKLDSKSRLHPLALVSRANRRKTI